MNRRLVTTTKNNVLDVDDAVVDDREAEISLREHKVSNGMRRSLENLINILQCPLCHQVCVYACMMMVVGCFLEVGCRRSIFVHADFRPAPEDLDPLSSIGIDLTLSLSLRIYISSYSDDLSR